MLNSIVKSLGSKPKYFIICLSAILIIIVAYLDFRTGYELSFSLFYLVPILLASWFTNRLTGIAFCFVSAAAWLSADKLTGHQYSHDIIPFWNSSIRLGFFLISCLLISEVKRLLLNEQKLARTDGLTGLLNKQTFIRVSTQILNLAGRHNQSVAIGFIDIDNFKKLNDNKGHATGDLALKMVADTLTRSTRSTDIIGRLGGDEFAIVLPFTSYNESRIMIDKVKSYLELRALQQRWPIGFSIGVAIYTSKTPTIDTALENADQLMYQVKRAGKDNIIYKEYS